MDLTNLDMDLTNYPNKFPHLVSNGNNFGRDRRILALQDDIRGYGQRNIPSTKTNQARDFSSGF